MNKQSFVAVSAAKQKIRRNLTYSTCEGGCHALMVGLSETYFAAFYIAVGLSDFNIGLMATVPYLLGSALQMLTPWGVARVGSYRTWTVGTVVLQGLSLLAMAVLAYFNQVSFWVLLAIATVYWASGLATGPAWNTWIEFVVPKQIRAQYFSMRMRVCKLCLIAAIATSGLVLRGCSDESGRLLIFVGLFSIAGLLRVFSVAALGRQFENRNWLIKNLAAEKRKGEGPDVGQLVKTFLPFFAAMQLAVYISGPYFAPFMLRNLGLSHMQFMVLILLGYFGRVVTLPLAGRIAKSAGPGRLMLWGAMGIVPLSGLWFWHQSFVWLCMIQIVSGAAWSCYELAMSLVFIERIPSHHRMRVLSWFNTFNGIAMLVGSIIGGVILTQMENSIAGFMTLFLLSGACRIIAFYWFPFSLVETRISNRSTLAQPWQVASPLLNGRAIMRPFFVAQAVKLGGDLNEE